MRPWKKQTCKLVKTKGDFVWHKAHAENECEILLLERKGLVNTGDADAGDLTVNAERI